ncbi:hypothetical protein AAFC00_005173 [Neodothiora populina]|uniref:LysM domain-containing protein n=1 Tax=Neodothiora populina TaxID=2781224 RepID=A0ABR3PK09_9PEZI
MSSVFTPTYNITATATTLPIANGSISDCFLTYENIWGAVPCQSAADEYDIDVLDFISWNPSLGDPTTYSPTDCVLANTTQYCVAFYDPSLLPNTTSVTNYVTPPNALPDSTTACDDWWDVQTGDTCDLILKSADIPLSSFYAWNPTIGDQCQNLWLNTSYCVAGPGWTNVTYASSTSAIITMSSTSSGGSPGPTQSGIVAGCDQWYVVVNKDTCQSIAANFSISITQFENWNPAVGSDCKSLWLNEAYCVHVPGATTIAPSSTSSAAPTTTVVQPPGPTQSGIASNCNAYAIPIANDGCYSFAERYSISLDQLYEWNPALENNCSNFWGGKAYCIGVST